MVNNKESEAHIYLAVVACGKERLNETVGLLKSAAALTTAPLHLLIFTDSDMIEHFAAEIRKWPSSVLSRVTSSIQLVSYPPTINEKEWKGLFKPCASQRLFLPMMLNEIDSLLYVDTDVLFLRPLERIWDHFRQMNASQMAAMAPEHEDFSTGWYNRFAQHPYYGPLGVNSGVMLMNLTRLRRFQLPQYVQNIYKEFKGKLAWGDQDLLNIVFHYHPDKLYTYPCEWNYRSDHCMYNSVCKTAEEHGVAVVHGSRGVFHSDKQPVFRKIYTAWQQYEMGSSLQTGLLEPLRHALDETAHTECGRVRHIFLKALELDLKNMR